MTNEERTSKADAGGFRGADRHELTYVPLIVNFDSDSTNLLYLYVHVADALDVERCMA